MDAAKMQTLIYGGYAKAAIRLGQSYQFYRISVPIPGPATQPYDTPGQTYDSGLHYDNAGQNTVVLNVSLNAEDMTYSRPNKYGKATWFALFDGTQAQVFDYFTGPHGTFFIAAMQPLLPILVVACNRIINVYRPQTQSGVGAVAYGGNTAANQTLIMKGWPCSILQGTKGEKNDTGLPGDARSPWWTVLLPDIGVQILPNDIITDDQNFRYVVSSPERTDLGFRITAQTALA